MPKLDKDDAHKIAKKLSSEPINPGNERLRVEVRTRGPHDVVSVWYKRVFVGRFGIQRGSKRNAQHNYISEQIHLTRPQGAEFASCKLSIDDYIEILLQDDEIPSQLDEDKS